MPQIIIHQEKAKDLQALPGLCPFGAIEIVDGKLSISSGCRMCRNCIRRGNGVFELSEEKPAATVDKSSWSGIAVIAEVEEGAIHPVSFELLGKARELAGKIGQKVYALLIGTGVIPLARRLAEYGADAVHVYDEEAFRHFRIEPYAAAAEDFIRKVRPCAVLVGGTPAGRSLAPRLAARFRTGLTADCTCLDISPSTDLDQIRPAYGGNIMAHINTPRHRPQFATVRYKIFSIPPKREVKDFPLVRGELPEEKKRSGIEILHAELKERVRGIEEAEVIVAAGRGVKKAEDLAMLQELADLLDGRLASTRALVEAGWMDARNQIGLSGRTVKPKLIITCGVSGAIQFVAGMNGSEKIVAINTDPEAPIFNVAHIGICGDLYKIVPDLIEKIKRARKD